MPADNMEGGVGDGFTFRVSDLKQYVYCARIVYYQTVLPDVRPVTYKMEAGIAAHRQEAGRERRRSLRAYGVADGERSFEVRLYSEGLKLSGELDMVIRRERELIPVDYKHAQKEGAHFRMQLYAYARLLQELEGEEQREIRRGFIYLIPLRRAVEIRFNERLRGKFEEAMGEMRAIVEQERMPGPTARRSKCVDCEFRRFCNDVL